MPNIRQKDQIQPAIATAKTFKWNQAPDAPDSQIGFVEINFSVGE